MRRVIPKDAVIQGEGKGFPYTVVADLAEVGVVCKTADGKNEILPSDTIQAHVTYSIKPAPTPEAATPPTDKPAKADKEKEVK